MHHNHGESSKKRQISTPRSVEADNPFINFYYAIIATYARVCGLKINKQYQLMKCGQTY